MEKPKKHKSPNKNYTKVHKKGTNFAVVLNTWTKSAKLCEIGAKNTKKHKREVKISKNYIKIWPKKL